METDTLTIPWLRGWIFASIFIVASLITTLTGPASFGQNRGPRIWEQGPLAESDFTLKSFPEEPSSPPSFIDASLQFQEKSFREGNTWCRLFPIEAVMFPENSWIDPLKYDSNVLKYNQVIFDMVESAKRDFLEKAHTKKDTYVPIEKYSRSLELRIAEFDLESDCGKDSSVVNKYSNLIQKELKSKDDHPELLSREFLFKRIKHGISLCVYGGYSIEPFLGKTQSFSGALSGWGINGNVGAYRFLLSFDMMAGNEENKYIGNSVTGEDGYPWVTGQPILPAFLNITLGYRALDRQYCSVIPFAGIGQRSISQRLPEDMAGDDADFSKIKGLGIVFGSSFNFKPFCYIYDTYAMMESILSFKVYAEYGEIYSLGRVWSLNFGLKLGIEGVQL